MDSAIEVRGLEELKLAGWSKHRHVQTESHLRALTESGFEPWDGIAGALSSLIDLSLAYERDGQPDVFWISPERACRWADKYQVDEYSIQICVRLCPIGYAHRDHLLIMLGENGTFYGGYDDFFAYLGAGVFEMVGNLISGTIVPIR